MAFTRLVLCTPPLSTIHEASVFLREETILVCVVPGPHEPSLEQLNYVLEPFVREVHILYGGLVSYKVTVTLSLI